MWKIGNGESKARNVNRASTVHPSQQTANTKCNSIEYTRVEDVHYYEAHNVIANDKCCLK